MRTPSSQINHEVLSPALRAVLTSPHKFDLLCTLETLGTASSKQLAASLDPPITHNAVNLHLKQLESLGWIRVDGHEQHRGAFARQWALDNTERSWLQFAEAITATRPLPRAA